MSERRGRVRGAEPRSANGTHKKEAAAAGTDLAGKSPSATAVRTQDDIAAQATAASADALKRAGKAASAAMEQVNSIVVTELRRAIDSVREACGALTPAAAAPGAVQDSAKTLPKDVGEFLLRWNPPAAAPGVPSEATRADPVAVPSKGLDALLIDIRSGVTRAIAEGHAIDCQIQDSQTWEPRVEPNPFPAELSRREAERRCGVLTAGLCELDNALSDAIDAIGKSRLVSLSTLDLVDVRAISARVGPQRRPGGIVAIIVSAALRLLAAVSAHELQERIGAVVNEPRC